MRRECPRRNSTIWWPISPACEVRNEIVASRSLEELRHSCLVDGFTALAECRRRQLDDVLRFAVFAALFAAAAVDAVQRREIKTGVGLPAASRWHAGNDAA